MNELRKPDPDQTVGDLLSYSTDIRTLNVYRMLANNFAETVRSSRGAIVEFKEEIVSLNDKKEVNEVYKNEVVRELFQKKKLVIGDGIIHFRLKGFINNGSFRFIEAGAPIVVKKDADQNVLEIESVIAAMNEMWGRMYMTLMDKGIEKIILESQAPPQSPNSFYSIG